MSLDASTGALVRLVATLAAGDRAAFRGAVDACVAACEPDAVEEALVQSYLFLGYPAALNGLAVWRERSGHRPAEDATPPEAWAVRGTDVCRAVYGDQYERLRANIRRLHPDMDRWMVVEGYGKVLGRPGLALAVRELCVVAVLAVLDAPVQLYSHLRGALRVGATPDDVEETLRVAGAAGSPAARARAAEAWSRLAGRDGDHVADPGGEPA